MEKLLTITKYCKLTYKPHVSLMGDWGLCMHQTTQNQHVFDIKINKKATATCMCTSPFIFRKFEALVLYERCEQLFL